MASGLAELAREASAGSLRWLLSGPGARHEVDRVIATLDDGGEIAVLCDSAPKRLDGAGVLDAVIGELSAHRRLRRVTAAEGPHGVVLDEETVDQAVADSAGVSVILAVGSGTVADLAKVVGARSGAPVVVVQTAASVNGYADSLSVLVVNGAKRTSPSTWPTALLIDHDILAQAPDRLTRAGVGDAVAVHVAAADWYLACALGMDAGYDEEIVLPVLTAAEGLIVGASGGSDALAAVVDTLSVGGLVIGKAGTTAPLSGCEHLVSHVLDMAAMAAGRDHDLHGAQVGVASVLSAALWDIAMTEVDVAALDFTALDFPDSTEQRVRETWERVDPSGRVGSECWAAVSRKAAAWREAIDARSGFGRQREAHARRLRELAGPPGPLARTLAAWSAPVRFSQLAPSVDRDLARWALAALPFMRDRLTLADVLLMAGLWEPEFFDRVFARAEEAGGGL